MLNYLDFLSKENPEVAKEWKEVNTMGDGLAMLMEPELRNAREQGIEQGKINSFVSLFNDKRITAKEGAEYLGIGVNEFLELVGKH